MTPGLSPSLTVRSLHGNTQTDRFRRRLCMAVDHGWGDHSLSDCRSLVGGSVRLAGCRIFSDSRAMMNIARHSCIGKRSAVPLKREASAPSTGIGFLFGGWKAASSLLAVERSEIDEVERIPLTPGKPPPSSVTAAPRHLPPRGKASGTPEWKRLPLEGKLAAVRLTDEVERRITHFRQPLPLIRRGCAAPPSPKGEGFGNSRMEKASP